MPDRETIITRLQIINTWATVDLRSPKEPIWSYRTLEDVQQWTNDAIALLKEQEPVKPMKIKDFPMPIYCHFNYECENCKTVMLKDQPYCAGCGKPVKWDE
jgi:hypothetical protein